MKRASSAAMRHDEPEDGPELVVENDLHLPEPLDHRIGGVWLRTTANNVTEGYDLLLSAAFGKERVVLKGNGYEIEVDFSLTSADLELRPLACSMAVIEEGDRSEDSKTTIHDQSSRETSWRADAKFHGSASTRETATAGASLGAEYHTMGMSKTTTSRKTEKLDWGRTGPNTLRIGPTTQALDGLMISEFKGWRVTPASTKTMSAVVAYLKVRENWIKFENISHITSPARFSEKLRRFLSTDDARRRRCFEILLAHLAQSGLNRHQEGKAATIAMHALVVRPEQSIATALPTGPNRSEIAIDGGQLDEFLAAEDGRELSALIALGVRLDMMEDVSEQEDAPMKRGRGQVFIPDSNPISAVSALNQLRESDGVIPIAEFQYPETLRDLRSLKLIKTGSGKVELLGKGHDVELMLRRALTVMDTMKVARAVVTINPQATYREVSEAVSAELGKKWPSDSTKKRKGNGILRWMAWLEPHLFDTEGSSYAASRVAYARSHEVERGAPTARRTASEYELRRLVAEGKNKAEMGRHLNVSPATISNWMREFGLKRLTKAALKRNRELATGSPK
jgi:DNA-binding CsgD family transcriptional regulator